MPEKETVERANEDLREGKAPSTAAGEFVREEVEHVREGKHGVRSPQQAIAIGLSKARRAGVPLPPPKQGKTSQSTRKKAERDYERGQKSAAKTPSTQRSQAREKVLKREPWSTASPRAMAKQAKSAAKKRGAGSRRAVAKKAVRTKGPAGRRSAAKKAARTRASHHRTGRTRGRPTRKSTKR